MQQNLVDAKQNTTMRLLQTFFNAIAAIGALWIFAIMMLIVADVIGRNLFATPITGVAEIAARSVVSIMYLLLPAAALNGSIIRADFLVRGIKKLSPRTVFMLDMIFSIAGAGIFLLVAISAWPDTYNAWVSSEFFGVRGVWTLPTFPFRLLVVFGAAATSIAFLATCMNAAGKVQSDE